MRIGVVVDDEMNAFDILALAHRKVTFDDDRNNSAVLRHQWHVQLNVALTNGTIPEQLLQDASNFLIGYFGVFGSSAQTRGGQ